MSTLRILMAMGAVFSLTSVAVAESGEDTEASLTLKPLAILGDARLRHAQSITHIEPLSDGRRALCSSQDGSVRLWDLTAPQPTAKAVRRQTRAMIRMAISN